jgi:hypothetical protein
METQEPAGPAPTTGERIQALTQATTGIGWVAARDGRRDPIRLTSDSLPSEASARTLRGVFAREAGIPEASIVVRDRGNGRAGLEIPPEAVTPEVMANLADPQRRARIGAAAIAARTSRNPNQQIQNETTTPAAPAQAGAVVVGRGSEVGVTERLKTSHR